MAKSKGGGGKSRSGSRPSYPAKTGCKSGSGSSNNTQANPSTGKSSSKGK